MIRNTQEIADHFEKQCNNNKIHMLRAFYVYVGVKIEVDKKSLEFLKYFQDSYKLAEVEDKYKLHVYYEIKAKEAEVELKKIEALELEKAEKEAKELAQSLGKDEKPKEVKKKKPLSKSQKIEGKPDYQLMFEKLYKMKDQVYKDYKQYLQILDNQKPKNVLLNKTATCQGYVNLFKELCAIVGITATPLSGYYKLFAENPAKFKLYDFVYHEWLCISVEGKKYMFDPFYGNWVFKKNKYEHQSNDFCFMADPDKFIYDYYPFQWSYMGKTKFNIMVWENKVKVMRQFWDFGLNLSSANNYGVVMSEDGSIDFNYKFNNKVELSARVSYALNGQIIEEGYVYSRNTSLNNWNLRINFPKKGHYFLEIFGKNNDETYKDPNANSKDKGKPIVLVKQKVVAVRSKGLKGKFPIKVTNNNIKTEMDLVGPLTYNLGRMKSDFELISSMAKEVAIFNKDKIEAFEHTERGTWRCSTPLIKGDAVIKVKGDDGNWLEGFKFLVK